MISIISMISIILMISLISIIIICTIITIFTIITNINNMNNRYIYYNHYIHNNHYIHHNHYINLIKIHSTCYGLNNCFKLVFHVQDPKSYSNYVYTQGTSKFFPPILRHMSTGPSLRTATLRLHHLIKAKSST